MPVLTPFAGVLPAIVLLLMTSCSQSKNVSSSNSISQTPASPKPGETLVDKGIAAELAVPPDILAAAQSYEKACIQGDARGCYHYENVLHVGSLEISALWAKVDSSPLEKACQGGDAQSCFFQAKHLDGVGGKLSESGYLYEKACNHGHSYACVMVARSGTNPATSFEMYKKACDAGFSAPCMRAISYVSELPGSLEEAPTQEQEELALLACERGDPAACRTPLGFSKLLSEEPSCRTCSSPVSESLSWCVRCLEAGKEKDDYVKQLGGRFSRRADFDASSEKIGVFLKASCAQGHRVACGDLAKHLLLRGAIAQPDTYAVSAREALEGACKNNYACSALVEMLRKGLGGPADLQRALALMKPNEGYMPAGSGWYCSGPSICTRDSESCDTRTTALQALKNAQGQGSISTVVCKEHSEVFCHTASFTHIETLPSGLQDSPLSNDTSPRQHWQCFSTEQECKHAGIRLAKDGYRDISSCGRWQ